jgi:GT2 family glycosyltransferase
MLGIAVATYRRPELVSRLVDALRALTSTAHELVVCDDHDGRDLRAWSRRRGVRLVAGARRGIAWNKNRGLFALASLGCDPLLLLEDDVCPVRHGWELDWVTATRRWHHLGYQTDIITPFAVGGSGTPADPWVNPAATAQCLSVSADVLTRVGYFDSRFRGYGHEHAEWTTRIKRLGLGFREATLPDGRRVKAQLYLSGGLAGRTSPSHRDERTALANRELQLAITEEPIHRKPWRDEAERNAFLAEQRAGGLQVDGLAAMLDAGVGLSD